MGCTVVGSPKPPEGVWTPHWAVSEPGILKEWRFVHGAWMFIILSGWIPTGNP